MISRFIGTSQSREMGHTDMQITKLYLESFGSRQVRKDYNSYSPVALLHLNKRSKGKRGT